MPPFGRVIGHRGAAARAPENTLAGLRRAKALGCSWVEFDVRLTGDGVPVLCHDSRLDRTTDGSGLIADLPLAALR
ncbi:MAG TPA: glycerophosphodiester phosphodiesterase family protein, partial [Stellaceae bacterium]|nr:glycerophosphodiester phosphodiesterase family protein [Stellaceae bacterium]